jgi:uncharacterized membrane protein YeiH
VHLSASELIGALDRIGIVAFALSGVEVGARRRLDVFGLLVMGVVTATGGGLMRDAVIGDTPRVLEQWDYLAWAVGASIAAIVLVSVERTVPRWLLAVADAAGLGAFAAAGALAGLRAGLPVTAVIVLAMLTATGGGVLRDLLANRVPLVLRAEVNATAAGLGGVVVWALDPVSTGGAALAGAAVAAAIRVATISFKVNLPRPGAAPDPPDEPNASPGA